RRRRGAALAAVLSGGGQSARTGGAFGDSARRGRGRRLSHPAGCYRRGLPDSAGHGDRGRPGGGSSALLCLTQGCGAGDDGNAGAGSHARALAGALVAAKAAIGLLQKRTAAFEGGRLYWPIALVAAYPA